jgi:hypothetical protein
MGADAFDFEVDILDNGKSDVQIRLQLRQNVAAVVTPGGVTATYLPEPTALPRRPALGGLDAIAPQSITVNGEDLPPWDSRWRMTSRGEEWFGHHRRHGTGPAPQGHRSSWAACSANLKRIGANVDPDGAAFPRANPAAICAGACARARAARCSRACANWPNGASMPPRWRRNQPVTNTADRVGSVSQFGQTVTVGAAQWPKDPPPMPSAACWALAARMRIWRCRWRGMLDPD